jgi:hypothetical protein
VVEAGTTYSIQSLGYAMGYLKFKSRERQKITFILLKMLIRTWCTQTGSPRILVAFSQGAWRSELEPEHSPTSRRDINKKVAMLLLSLIVLHGKCMGQGYLSQHTMWLIFILLTWSIW